MERYIFSSAGILLLGTLGAFLLFVPLLSIASVTLILLALGLMFCLGFEVGRRRLRRITKNVIHLRVPKPLDHFRPLTEEPSVHSPRS